MIAATPPMGWNSWNMFGPQIDTELVKSTADAFVSSGLRDAGYTYIVIDDLWHGGRGADGVLYPDAVKFPEGIRALADYVHSRGLKLGIYSDCGVKTCGGKPGSQDYEEIDAKTFASWDIDFLKYDWCYADDTRANAESRYTRMGKALRETGREIVFSICEWGHHRPWLWGAKAGGQLWRTTGDIGDSWKDTQASWGLLSGVESIGFEQQRGLEEYAGPGHWNDTDMLVVGLNGASRNIGGAGCTPAEYRTHFSLWCLLAAPLFIGCDVRAMDETAKSILLNEELIAVDQDPLGRQGVRVARAGEFEIWKKPLAGGELALGLFNRGARAGLVTAHWSDLEIDGVWSIRDLWEHASLGALTEKIAVEVGPHACKIYRFAPA